MLSIWGKLERIYNSPWDSLDLLSKFWRICFALAIALRGVAFFDDLPELLQQAIRYSSFAVFVIFLIFLVYDLMRQFRSKLILLGKESEGLRRPSPSTKNLVEKIGDTDVVPIGSVIPVYEFPLLRGIGTSQGATPEEVKFKVEGSWSSENVQSELLQRAISDDWNETKFILKEIKPQLNDRKTTSLILQRSDWNTVIPYTRFVIENEGIRHKYSFLDSTKGLTPENCVIPSSFCLHGILSFADDSLLVMNRATHLEPYRSKQQESETKGNNFSFSFEEQMSELDVDSSEHWNTMESWTRRALCEEVFPLKTKYKVASEPSWNLINDYVQDCRIWAFLHEETTAGWGAMVHFRLNLPSGDFLKLYKNLQDFTGDSRDAEGRFFIMPREDASELVYSGKASAHTLANKSIKVPVSVEQLHGSSLCRILTFLRLVTPA